MQRIFLPRIALLLTHPVRQIPSGWPLATQPRSLRHQAYESGFDEEKLQEARKWHKTFQLASLPEGDTAFSRASGPGGQHVNKTETKATTTWPLKQLLGVLPGLLHQSLRSSKYYSQRTDSISIQAQTERSRSANRDENHQKLYDELRRLYKNTVPGETSLDKTHKYEALRKSANETRIKSKKQHASKKQSRKGGAGNY